MATPLTDKDFEQPLTDQDFLTDADFAQPNQQPKSIDFMGTLQAAGKTASSMFPTPKSALTQTPGMNIYHSGVDALSEQIKGQAKEATGFKMPFVSDIAFDPRTYMGLKGAEAGVTSIPKQSLDTFAGKLVNSLIKPIHKQFMFGKNPGMGIAKEGLTDFSLSGLSNKVEGRIGEINNAIKEIRSSADHVDKVLDLRSSLKPFSDALSKLMKAPKSNETEINQVSNIFKDLVNLKDKPLEALNLKDAYELKGVIRDLQSWKTESIGGTELNTSLRQAYHNIDEAIDTAVPGLKGLNERLANMISAKQAIAHRVEILSKHEPSSLMNALDLPFKAFKTPIVKTGIAKLLSEKYPVLVGR